MLRYFAAGLAVIMTVSACAYTPHDVEITAQAPKTKSTIGADVKVNLQVIDDRESQIVGQRGAGMIGADITAEDIMQVLAAELAVIFEANGFSVLVPGSNSDAEVEARLRAFKFFVETGFFTGAENASVVVAMEAEKNGKDFDRTYRSSSEHAVVFVPGETSINAKLNAALSEVLRQIANDQGFMNFLAQ